MLSALETARMDGVTVGFSVIACLELGFSGGSNLSRTLPSLGSLGLLRSGSESPYLFGGINDGRWEGSHVGVKALMTATSGKVCFRRCR